MSYALWEGLAVASAPSPLLAAAGAGIDASPAAAVAPRTRPMRPIAARPDVCRANGAARRPLSRRTHQDFHRSMTHVQASETMPAMVNRRTHAARVVRRPSRASRSTGPEHVAHAALAALTREAARKINGGVEPAATPDSGASPGPHTGPGAATG
ncbi:hypothetical protein [Burkholderia perseverans]|uniref:hypothetical protein n=1 Tax=Burkholderia perseverans TaxID=2615214 RepID=UPI001FEE0044|nr:hypothetical protein [Burkholderia perseverans]